MLHSCYQAARLLLGPGVSLGPGKEPAFRKTYTLVEYAEQEMSKMVWKSDFAVEDIHRGM